MPGFGNPLDLDMRTFFELRKRALRVARVTQDRADNRDLLELENMGDG